MKKLSALFLSLVFAVSLFAAQIQYPVNPNPTAFQTTPYSTSAFSATFNGGVETSGYRSSENHSSNSVYISTNHGVMQRIVVRTVDYDIPVDLTSSNFYADDDTTGGTIDNRSTAVWEGHPYTYTRHLYTVNGVEFSKRTRYIIVNSRTAIFIQQVSASSYNDQPEWYDFEYSLRIR